MTKFKFSVTHIETLEEVPNYWTNQDYIELLKLFNFPDAESIQPENLREMLFMAISDEPANEAAKTVLTYKLSDDLSEGQIDQLSNDMLLDKISEEYPEIHLHYPLYTINQLLFHAYNGTFLNTKATRILIETEQAQENVTKEFMLKALNSALSPSNIIMRLFENQMTTETRFPDAESIFWQLNSTDNKNFEIITSDYWINRDDLPTGDYEGEVLIAEEVEE